MSAPVLAVRDLRLRRRGLGEELVHGVTFTLQPRAALGIVGESGSGKTLTCRAVLGVLPRSIESSHGRVELLGRDIADFTRADWDAARGGSVGAVLQDPASYLNPALRVGKQIAEVFRVKRGLGRKPARTAVLRLFESLSLREPERVFDQHPHELSGGMLQRVLIASAIALEPELLIADEATTALDVTVQAEILDLLGELRQRTGLALIVVSHDLAVIAQLCDEVLVMKSGHVVEQGPVAHVLRQPRHAYTQLLIARHEAYGLDRISSAARRDHAS